MTQSLSKQELAEFERSLRALHASVSMQAGGLETCTFEETGVDRIPFSEEALEQAALERELQVIRVENEIAAKAQAAVRRIHEGTFGICTDCDRPIERERLRVVPYASQCSTCAR